MANSANYMLLFLFLILIADHTHVQAQQPSPADPCKLYDFNTGLTSPSKQFEVAIKETDGALDPLQVVKVPISGRTEINLVGETLSDTTTLSTYDIQFYYNSGNGFVEMSVGKPLDRDGADYQDNDNLDVIQFNLECQFTSGGTSAKDYFGVTVRILDSNDNSPQFVNLPYNVAIKEALPISTTVCDSISATDKDANRNKEILFAITGGAAYAGQTYFNMPDPGVGYIMLARSLDYEFLDQNNAKEFRVTITARDNAVIEAERRTSTSTVTVTIEDSDDLTPTFYHTGCRQSSTLLNSCDGVKYRADITSGIVTGGSIPVIPIVSGSENTAASLRAFDMDKLNAPIIFEIIGSTPSGYEDRFDVSTSAKETDAALPGRDIYRATLTQTSTITRSEAKIVTLFLKARQTDDPQKYRTAEIDFTVQPSNQNNPVVTIPTGTTGFIEENVAFGANVRATATGTPALEIVVTDADVVAGDSQSYIYSITTAGIPFSIQSSSGSRATIYATGSLNREAVPSYTFTVRATENITVGARSGDLQVTVQIQDVNDNTPMFTGSGYTRTIVEGDYSGVNRVLLTDAIRATDIDAGDNGHVSYSIKNVSVTAGSLTRAQVLSFLTIEANGDVYLNGAVSSGLAFIATIVATDNSSTFPRMATETLIMTVTSLGNNPPQFSANSFTVQESEASPGGTFVFSIAARDLEDATLSYTIQTPYIQGTSNKFTITGTTEGTIRVAGLATAYPLDYETEPRYVFIVRATDSTGRSGTATVTVDILNVNDNAPVFSTTTYTFGVDEGLANAPVGTVSGSDADRDTVSFSLVDTTAFTINSNTSQISTLAALDYETKKQYVFVARITDSGNPSLTGFAQVTVNVNDLNDNIPLFVDQIYQGYVLEGQNGVPILRTGSGTNLRVSALDADSVPRVSYIFQIQPNNDFNIDANSGDLTTKRALDFEVQRSYSFYVTTEDGTTTAQNSPNSGARALVQINVIDVNDNNPVITASTSSISVPEDFVEYGVSTNVLPELNFGISGTDADEPSTANSRITYSIASVTPTSAQNKFIIYPGSSRVTVVSTLIDVSSSPITLRIQGTDGGSPPRSDNNNLQVTVNLLRNNAPQTAPAISASTSVNDNVNVNTVIYSFAATDPDTGRFGTLTDALTGETDALSQFTFSRRTSNSSIVDVVLSSSLGNTDSMKYVLTFVFSDGGFGLAKRTTGFTLTFNVNRNRNAPSWLFTPSSSFVVSENIFLGTPVATINIQDLDLRAPNNLMDCNVIADTVALDFFRTETDNTNDICYVYMKRSPARDRTVNTFNVRMSMVDRGLPTPLSGPNLNIVFNIKRNDQPPLFFDLINGVYTQTINENEAVGFSVKSVSASDADPDAENNQITYSIVGDDTAPNLFAIRDVDIGGGQTRGLVTVKGNLSSEAKSLYAVRIVATDNAFVKRSATAMLYVTVKRNFLAPEFDLSSRSLSAIIPEDQDLGVQIQKLTGSDGDKQPPNNVVNYRFLPNSAGKEYFEVNAATGVVSVKKDLTADPTRAESYVLTFEIFDLGSPSLISSITATVTVTVIRNIAPFFVDASKATVVNESVTTPYNVASFNYNDLDESNGLGGKFAQLSFRIRNPTTASNFFTLSNNAATKTLTVQTTRSLLEPTNINRVNKWDLLLEVQDDGGLIGDARIEIRINRNLFPPVMTAPTQTVQVLENLPQGSSVGTAVRATDQDSSSPYNVPSYYIVSGSAQASTYFNIDSATGQLYVNRRLSAASTTDTTYTLNIGARDGGDIQLTSLSSTQFTITVLRNLETPAMTEKFVAITVSKNEIIGTTVFTFTATDKDDPVKRFPFQDLTYSIVSGLGASAFTVDTVTDGTGKKVGRVRLTGNLNSAGLAEYDLIVSACDRGDPPKCDYGNLRITAVEVIYSGDGNITTKNLCNAGERLINNTCIDKGVPHCLTENDTHGNIWNEAEPGTTVSKQCQTNYTGQVSRQCTKEGKWLLPIYDCFTQELQNVAKDIEAVLENPEKALSVVSSSLEKLKDITSKPEGTQLFSGEIEKVTSVLENIADISDKMNVTDTQTKDFLETTSNLLDSKNTNAWKSVEQKDNTNAQEQDDKGAEKILTVISKYSDAVAKTLNSTEISKTVAADNLVLHVSKITDNKKDIMFPDSKTQQKYNITCSFRLPYESIKELTNYSSVVYKNLSGILSSNSVANGKNGSKTEIRSCVISVKIDNWQKNRNRFQIQLTLEHFKGSKGEPHCSFWNDTESGWDGTGCTLDVFNSNDSVTSCNCTHLTNFAILMSPIQDNVKNKAIDIITITGCSLSLIALLLTVAVHAMLWRYLKSDRVVILVNLSVALIISYLIFLIGVDRTENKAACTAVAVLLQYIYLVVLFLMLVEGIEIAVSVLYVFVTKTRLKWLLPAAWLIPAAIVGISLGATQLKGYGNDQFCWLSVQGGLIWAFIGPACTIIIVNFVLLVLVMKAMFKTKTLADKSRTQRTKAGVRCLCVLLPLVGCTWLIGIFYVNKSMAWIQYVFAVCNGLQGLVIFICHCAMNKQIRTAIQRRKKKYFDSRMWSKSSSNPFSLPRATTAPSSQFEISNSFFGNYESKNNQGRINSRSNRNSFETMPTSNRDSSEMTARLKRRL